MALWRIFFFAPICVWAFSYQVEFIGLSDRQALKAIEDVSELISLQNRPPASINGLRYRIASDIPEFLRVLKAFSYYDAVISSNIQYETDVLRVLIYIYPGSQYKLASYEVFSGNCTKLAEVPHCPPFTPKELGLKIGAPATSVDIVNAELEILFELSRCGYPLATIDKRKVIVDMASKKIEAAACIQEGPSSKFGPTTLFGLKTVEPRFIEQKIAWQEGEIYDSDLVIKTQERLLKSELFSSVYVNHGEELDTMGELPMKMRVTESKHRQISIGVFYATVDGPGFSFAWTHRNVRGMGEIISTKGDFSQRYYSGNITYKKPDFFIFDQTYRALFQVSWEKIKAYRALTYRGANYIDRKIDSKRYVSFGLKYDNIHVTDSASNGSYSLLGLPIFGRYDTSNSVLDPTEGFTIAYSITPYQSLSHASQRFVKQRVTSTVYIPLGTKWFVLALRGQVGSIAGQRQRNVPLNKLFLGGSEDDLRGYRYKTVSPLNANRKPLGGRSAIFSSVELRIRVFEKFGIVPFADFGTVTLSETPRIDAKWFKSLGFGLRYFAFFGPLRFDMGFPLDKRRGLDSNFQIYASVGQAF